MTNRDLLLKTISQLREIMQSLDDAGIGEDAALHISWAIDLLEGRIVNEHQGG